MPIYVYRREDGSTFEVQQRITEPALETCPTTGQPVKRVISSAGVIFKGSGFYETDYVRKRGGEKESGGDEPKSENGKKSGGGEAKGEKSNAKAEATQTTSETTTTPGGSDGSKDE